MKRLFPLALCLILMASFLAVPVSADETEDEPVVTSETVIDFSTFNFSVTRLSTSSSSSTYDVAKYRSVLYNAYGTNSAVITSCNSKHIFGYFWDDTGVLCMGAWTNPISANNASLLGVFPLSSLELISYRQETQSLYFSKSFAEQSENFLTTTVYAVCWDIDSTSVWNAYTKKSTDSVWLSSVSTYRPSFMSFDDELYGSNVPTKYYASGADYVLWNVVPEGGTTSGSGGSGDGDATNAPYIYVSTPTTVTKGLYIIPRAELMNPGDISGNILCFLSGHNSAYTKLTESDSLDNMWTLDCGRDETASSLTLTFMVDGRPDIYTTCVVSVLDSETDNEGSSGDIPGNTEAPTEPTYSGSEDADDFNDSVGDQKDDFDDSMDILEDYTRPNYDDIDPGFDDILDGDPINKVSEFFAEIFDNDYIQKVFFIAFLLAAISFIVFGKR